MDTSTTVSYSIGIGHQALTNANGGTNTIVGAFSRDAITTGANNVGLAHPGFTTTRGSNVLIGHDTEAVQSGTYSSRIRI